MCFLGEVKVNITKLLEETLLTECAEDFYQDGTSVASMLNRFRGWGLEQQVIEHQKNFHISGGLLADRLALDDFLWWVSVYTIFYAGMRFETVQKKLPRMHERLGDYRVVMRYGENDVESLCSDSGLIRHGAKIKSCVSNANIFDGAVKSCGSFSAFLGQHVSISRTYANYIFIINTSIFELTCHRESCRPRMSALHKARILTE
ncbi:MAG: hypothetical protein RLY71_2357 [Pseudomonadota bacterium]|jgi:hypothetical protein